MKRKSNQISYCKKCQKHQKGILSITKKKNPSELSRGQRKFRKITSGYGGFPRPKPKPKKQNPIKRANLMWKCTICNKATHPGGIKAKKAIIVKTITN